MDRPQGLDKRRNQRYSWLGNHREPDRDTQRRSDRPKAEEHVRTSPRRRARAGPARRPGCSRPRGARGLSGTINGEVPAGQPPEQDDEPKADDAYQRQKPARGQLKAAIDAAVQLCDRANRRLLDLGHAAASCC